VRAAIHCRLSKNRKGEKANVKEQERDCREFVEAQGWHLTDVSADDGFCASDKSTKPRVQFPCGERATGQTWRRIERDTSCLAQVTLAGEAGMITRPSRVPRLNHGIRGHV